MVEKQFKTNIFSVVYVSWLWFQECYNCNRELIPDRLRKYRESTLANIDYVGTKCCLETDDLRDKECSRLTQNVGF